MSNQDSLLKINSISSNSNTSNQSNNIHIQSPCQKSMPKQEENSKSDEEKVFFQSIIQGKKYPITNLIKNDNQIWTFKEETDGNSGLHVLSLLNMNTIFTFIIEEILYFYKTKASIILSDWINSKNIKGETCIHYLSYKGNLELIQYLDTISSKYNITIDFSSKNLLGNNILHFAAQGNSPSCFIYSLHKYSLNPEEFNFDRQTPLHWASYLGADVVFEYILKQSMNSINQKDVNGYTPLHLTVVSNSLKLTVSLLRSGADRTIKDNKGRTAYDLALKSRKYELMKVLNNEKNCFLYEIHAPLQKNEGNKVNLLVYILLNTLVFLIMLFFIMPYYDNVIFLLFCLLFIILPSLLYANLIFSPPYQIDFSSSTSLYDIIMKGKYVTDYCPKCISVKSPNVKHCSICDVCIVDFDHHCYWINNCVGKGNIFKFRVFLGLVLIEIGFYLIISGNSKKSIYNIYYISFYFLL